LFEGTLLENITLGRPNATFENVRWAVDSMGLKKLINDLPLGYDTKVFPQGRQFSKSTVARIVLARSIVDRPRLLLFENSFSVFADQDRDEILSFLLNPEHTWTVILTSAQKLNVSKLVDREVCMQGGQITQIKK